jgi:hypothetical protein
MAETYDVEQLLAENSTSREKFSKLDADRSAVLDRARECSKLTIPSVVTDDGHTESDDLDTPYQAVGSRLVHNLASKLLLALMPPNTSFFRLLPNPEVVEFVKQQSGDSAELESNLVTLEQEMMKQIEREALRVPIFEAIKSLIIGGNALLYKTATGVKSYKMANFVVARDYSGNPTEIISKEAVTKDTLPEDILQQLAEDPELADATKVTIYTRAIKKEGVWYEFQEVEGILVEGSDLTYTDPKELPFIPLRWTSINGESYGRGLVEQYLGDFRSLEALYQLLLEASSVMSRVIFGKRAGSVIDVDDINEAENGVCILGDLEQDITTLRVDKGADLQVPMNMVQDLTRRLEQAFLVASSATRDSERTTATEIRYMAADLEKSLGGVYSILSLELQRPLAYLLLKQSKADVESLGIELVIVTGVEALGRNVELDKIRQFNQLIQELGSPEIILSRLNVGTYIDRIANSLALDTTGLIKTDEQIQQEQQAQQQQALLQQGAQGLVDGATGAVGQAMQNTAG